MAITIAYISNKDKDFRDFLIKKIWKINAEQ